MDTLVSNNQPDDNSEAKTENQVSPSSLKISQVYSKGKIEPVETSAMHFIRVKTPGQLNGNIRIVSAQNTPSTTSQKQTVFVKRLGNTSIRGPAGKVGEALKAQMVKLSKNSYKMLNSTPNKTTTPKTDDKLKMNLPMSAAGIEYYQNLEKQNREMKSLLLDCKVEALAAQRKAEQLTAQMNKVISRIDNATGLTNIKKFQRMVEYNPTLIVKPQTPLIKIPTQSPSMIITPQTLTTKPATSTVMPKPGNKGQVVRNYQMPLFPIKSLNTLQRFENNLHNVDYFQYVFQRFMGRFANFKMMKPGSMLVYLLQSLINVELLGEFEWDYETAENPLPIVFSIRFGTFKVLMGRLSDELSKKLYGKILDKRVIGTFLRAKIHAQKKIRQMRLLNQQPNTSKSGENVTTLIRAEPVHNDDSPSGDGEKMKEIRWIDDRTSAEDVNMEGQKDDAEKEATSENHDNKDEESDDESSESDGDNENNLESILDEHDFEFLDC